MFSTESVYIGDFDGSQESNSIYYDDLGQLMLREIHGNADFRFCGFKAPYLRKIMGTLEMEGYTGTLNALCEVGHLRLDKYSISLNSLEIVKNIYLNDYPYPLPHLNRVDNELHITMYNEATIIQCPRLEFIGKRLTICGNQPIRMPNLLSVNHLYIENDEAHQFHKDIQCNLMFSSYVFNRSCAIDAKISLYSMSIFGQDITALDLHLTHEQYRAALLPKVGNAMDWKNIIQIYKIKFDTFQAAQHQIKKDFDSNNAWLEKIKSEWEQTEKFSMAELLRIENPNLRQYIFRLYDNPNELIHSSPKCRLNTAGHKMRYRQIDALGRETTLEKHNVYETYRIALNSEHKPLCQSLFNQEIDFNYDTDSEVFAVKCWCTTTDKEHWIFIDARYAHDPLEAIASTFHLHDNILFYCTGIQRQGDILIVEMPEYIEPIGHPRPMTKFEYFRLMIAES